MGTAAPKTAPIEILREPAVSLPGMAIGEEVICDYSSLRLSLKRHPLDLLRPNLKHSGAVPAERLLKLQTGNRVNVAGLVICRQRPGTASGVIFMTLEDETGIANIVVWPKMFEHYRKVVLRSRLIGVTGKVEREGLVIHVIADGLVDMSDRLMLLAEGRDLPVEHKITAQKWGTANFDAVNLGRMLAGSRRSPVPGVGPPWSGEGRADQAHTEPSDQRLSLKRSFPSHDFH